MDFYVAQEPIQKHVGKCQCVIFCCLRTCVQNNFFFFHEWEHRTGTMCPFSSLYPLRKGKGLNDRNKSEIYVYFPVVQEPIRNTKIIYIPWPFPSVWGVADNAKETTKTMGISLRSSSNDKGPSRVWMALLEQHSPFSPVYHNLRRFIDAISPTAPTTGLPL